MAGYNQVFSAKRADKRRLGLPGEDAAGVMTLAEFQELSAKRSYRMRGETLVTGGSDDAFEAACAAVRLGSEKVTLVCPERAAEMRAQPDKIDEAKQAGIKIIRGWGPARISVHTDGAVSGVFFKHCERAFNSEGNFAPVYDEANVMGQYCDNLIVAGD